MAYTLTDATGDTKASNKAFFTRTRTSPGSETNDKVHGRVVLVCSGVMVTSVLDGLGLGIERNP